MTANRVLATVAALGVLLLAPGAAAEPPTEPKPMPTVHLRLKDDSVLVTGTGQYKIPAGSRVIEPVTWNKLDVEMKRLQDAETKLAAENRTMRKSLDSWQPGWKTSLSILVVGLSLGGYVGSKL